MTCVCGHPEEDHSRTGECKVDGCTCGCYEEEDEEELEELEGAVELWGLEDEYEGEEDDLDEDPW